MVQAACKSYELNFDKNKLDNDKVFEHNGIKIVVDKKSFLYLIGTTLEYSGGLNGKGFIFLHCLKCRKNG